MTLTLYLPRELMAHGRLAVSPLTTVTLLIRASNSGSMLHAVPRQQAIGILRYQEM